MDKLLNECGSIGLMDGIKVEGDVGNECYICKVNLVMIDDIGKKYGLEDMLENFFGKKYVLVLKVVIKFFKVSRCYVVLGKVRCVLWWLGLLLFLLVFILWVEWGVNGDDDIIICRVLMFFFFLCMNLIMVIEYVCRFILVLIMGVVCWIVVFVIFGVCLYM